MISYLAVLRRRPELSRAEFLDRWLGEHQALALTLPHVESVRFVPTTDRVLGQEYDGIGFLDFARAEDLEAALVSPVAARLREHTGSFADPDAAVRLVVESQRGAHGAACLSE